MCKFHLSCVLQSFIVLHFFWLEICKSDVLGLLLEDKSIATYVSDHLRSLVGYDSNLSGDILYDECKEKSR